MTTKLTGQVTLTAQSHTDVVSSQLLSRPPTQTTRGFDASTILIDEAAFLSYQTWTETITPVLAQSKTSLIAASTALDDRNYFSSLTKLRDPATGELIFNVVRISQICKRCRESETPHLCTHLLYKLPAWKSSKKTARMKAFYAGNEHLHMREILGEIANDSKGAYAAPLIKRFRDLPRFVLKHQPKAIYWGVDPGGGGPGELGHAAVVDFDGIFVIVALASVSLRGERAASKERATVMTLLERMRQKPLLRDVPIVMICEAAPGIAAAHISTYVRDVPNLVFMHERAGGGEGVPKNDETTSVMKGEFEELLEQNLVRFDANFVTFEDAAGAQERERERLFTQLSNLRYEALQRAHDHDDQRYKITAKVGGTSDDLLVSLMMTFYWKRRFWRSSSARYSAVKQQIRERVVNPKTLQLAAGDEMM